MWMGIQVFTRKEMSEMKDVFQVDYPPEKKQYWCMFCSFRAWFDVRGEEFKTCPRCGNGMFVWGKEGAGRE